MDDNRSIPETTRSSSRRTPGRLARWALAGATTLALLAPPEASATVAAFPPDSAWVPALLAGVPLNDPEGDTPGPRDIVGDAANPMLYLASDATHIYFRLRVDQDPQQSATTFTPYGWGCYINTDANKQTYEFSTIVNGNNNPDDIAFYKNTVTLTPDSPNDDPDLPALEFVQNPLSATVGHARVVPAPSNFGGTPDFFIDWAIERSTANAAGFDPSLPTNYYCGSANGNAIDADCSGGSATGCLLSSQFSDPVTCGVTGCNVCGDGKVGGLEGCDDGNLTNGDGCNTQCLKELGQPCTLSGQCASGFCDPTGLVCACDQDSDCPTGRLCNTTTNPNTCVLPGCGNGILEAGEACEDGNLTNGDGCTSACLRELGQPCTVASQCASGFCDPANNTCACDQDADCPAGRLCNTLSNPNLCVNPGCGNGVKEATEGCDDGNILPLDGCNAVCLIELGQPCTVSSGCASGFCDPAGNICACDGDSDCPAGQSCNVALNPNQCVPGGCGNGVLELGEACEDGNLINGDGCNAQCLRELGQPCTLAIQCASGFCDPAGNVCACDQDSDCPGVQICKTSTNPNQCVNPGCGNGVLESGEGCDDNNTVNGDGCNSACLKELGQPCAGSAQCASGFCDPAGNVCACDQDTDCPAGRLCYTVPNPNTCVNPGCGNGIQEAGEGCDDANNTNGDGCNSVCLLELGQPCTLSGQCASGFCDPSGNICACDQTSDCPAGQLCNTTANPNLCVNPGCGNGVLEATEGCDDANTSDGDGCTAACLLELGQPCTNSVDCASGLCDPTGNICACDMDADCPAGLQCNTAVNPNQCVPPGCGNGVLEAGEGCDDNNLTNGDGCNAQCLKELGQPCTGNAVCASAFCDPTNNTCACDQDVDCPSGQLCRTNVDPNTCVNPGCGNGVLEANEGCDDGNTTNGDGCNSVCLKELGQPCTVSSQCASTFCDPAGNLCACDGDNDCPNGQLCNTTPDPNTCVNPGCGNGVKEAAEGCDDGNTTNGDGCNSACLKELGQPCGASNECASGLCDPTNNACACDDNADCPAGQVCDVKANPNECKAAGCGNNVLEPGEACDDGNLLAGDGCTALCLKEIGQPCALSNECASGFCDPVNNACACDGDADCPSGEQCNTTLDPNQCVPVGCGNGVQSVTEACDDGNLVNGDGCNAQCLKELGQPCGANAECASGFCDPTGNICACDGDNDCPNGQLCRTNVDPNTCVAPGCGNGVLEAGEGCDDGNTTAGDGCSASCLIELGEPCTDMSQCSTGFCDGMGSICACDDDTDCPTGQICNTAADPNVCVPAGCGNGVVETGEGCDDGNTTAGDGCNVQCLKEIGQPCTLSNECASAFCDPAGNTCACDDNADCPMGQLCDTSKDPNVCVASGCGNGVLESGEGCDDGNTTSGDGCNAQCLLELGEPCTSSPSCASGFCDPTGNICSCNDDADCPNGQICDSSVMPHACVDSFCGNGTIEGAEGCDDQNTTAGDGCSATCTVESGWTCTGEPSVCTPIPQCTTDADCNALQICDVSIGKCVDVECKKDSDCTNGTCDTATNTCKPAEPTGYYAVGNGCACRVGDEPSSESPGLLISFAGLLAVAARRARRRKG